MAADAPGVVTCMAKPLEIPYFCCECKRYFSVKIGTVMEHSKISCWRWAVATYLLATRPTGLSNVQLGRDLGIADLCMAPVAQYHGVV